MWKEAKVIDINELVEIRWHGRGGQGAVTSAELLARAAIDEGKYAQAFPSFGPERRGAPVLAFDRISAKKPIRVRAEIREPDVVIVLDSGLLQIVNVVHDFDALTFSPDQEPNPVPVGCWLADKPR